MRRLRGELLRRVGRNGYGEPASLAAAQQAGFAQLVDHVLGAPGGNRGIIQRLFHRGAIDVAEEDIGIGRVEYAGLHRPAQQGLGVVDQVGIHRLIAGDEHHERALPAAAGTPAYNLAVVVDDAYQGIDQVVRGDDLLSSAPRQAYLASLLGIEPPEYIHVPLVLNASGERLAKRDGAVTMREMGEEGDVVKQLAASLGYKAASAAELLAQFAPDRLSPEPYIWRG